MIAPMKKVYLLLLESEKEAGLLELRQLGLVHLETLPGSGAVYSDLARKREDIAKALNIIPAAKGQGEPTLASSGEAIELASRVIAMEARKSALQLELGSLEGEMRRAETWGNWKPDDIAFLKGKGLEIEIYDADAKVLASLPEDLDAIVLARAKKSVKLAIVRKTGDPLALPSGFVRVHLPEPPSILSRRMDEKARELEAIALEMRAAAAETDALRRTSIELEEEMNLITARGSFTQDGPVSFIKGFIPAASLPALEGLASEKGWVVLAGEPEAGDATPTKVENNRFERMIKPVFDFLGIVPGYGEYEISPWFLGFFSLFTAMIFGDGGYGLIMSLGCAFAFISAKRKGKAVSDALRLFALISGITLLWGLLTATWFSLKAEQLPPMLRHMAIWAISSENPAASKNIQVLCFVIGAIQLSIARIKNIVRDLPDLKSLAQFGALALIWGMFFLVLNLVVDSKRFPLPPFCVWLIAGGFGASLVFGAYEGNILKSFLEGLKNIIPTFLSSVGVFADIVSYIRLWALGLAGSSLAAIINSMGGGMLKPAFIALAGILILVLGHALNLVLSVLSVVVHAIRLNVLEFSCNHLGMQWSGIKYEPFASRERS